MIDPQLLNGRRIHAILFLADDWLDQRAVTGIGAWDGARLFLVPDGRQPPLPIATGGCSSLDGGAMPAAHGSALADVR